MHSQLTIFIDQAFGNRSFQILFRSDDLTHLNPRGPVSDRTGRPEVSRSPLRFFRTGYFFFARFFVAFFLVAFFFAARSTGLVRFKSSSPMPLAWEP
jgi:hypothetical protein